MSYDPTHRYLVFAGEDYYPSGGWGDFVGSFATEAEAREYAGPSHHRDNWSEIIDRETGTNLSGLGNKA